MLSQRAPEAPEAGAGLLALMAERQLPVPTPQPDGLSEG